MKQLILLALLFSLTAITTSNAQTKSTQKETFQATYDDMKALVQSKTFAYVGDYVFNSKRRIKLDGNTNTVNINNTEATGQIEALATTKSTKGIKGKISNYNVSFNDDKQQISIEFKVDDTNVNIDIKPNGNAFFTLKSSGTTISQVGRLKTI